MRLHDVADTYSEFKKSCCSLDAADDARRVAAQLGHPVLRHEPRARVRRRRAPAVPRRLPRRPDAEPVRRLQHVRQVRGAARAGAAPVRVRGGRDRPLRARATSAPTAAPGCSARRDEDKDQTYFLYGLRQDQLEHARFPLGELTKPEVRASRDRSASPRPTSPRARRSASSRAATTATRCASAPAGGRSPGRCSTSTASAVGEHGGAAGYTVGQRQGLGVALGRAALREPDRPAHEHDPLGRREDLETHTVDARASVASWPASRRAGRVRSGPSVRIRHRATPVAATVRPAGRRPAGRCWTVETDAPVWAAAPGQAAVLYDGDVVLGGGRIAPTARCSAATGRRVERVDPALDPRRSWSGSSTPSLYVLIRGIGRRAAAAARRGRDPRRVGRRRARRPAGDHGPLDRRLPPAGRARSAVGRDRAGQRARGARPVRAQGLTGCGSCC